MKRISCLLVLSVVACGSFRVLAAAEAKAWEEPLVIPTWQIAGAEVNPTFVWSSDRGDKIYPYPYKELLTDDKKDQTYRACWLENEFIKVLVLPEIGGRLHGATDKTNGYNFFYWQPTIKPALVGMTGAWISGGIEWNFPHGHRPTAFSPVSYRIVDNADGSKTVWVGETEWVFRTRWIIGLTIYPGKSVIEAKVRLMNPSPLPHSFQMWATTAVNANENYQAIYPTRVMTGHGKTEFWRWPVDNGVDISWWKNIPNASSFFAVETGDFFGGYDHGKQAGTVITGDPRTVIGKKLWTWGTSPSGRIWEPILTEGQGPYFEPQAGAFSDNQPDYHWIQPGEIKVYSHYFFPVRDIGAFKQANVNGALNLETEGNKVRIGVYSTSVLENAEVLLTLDGKTVFEKKAALDPGKSFTSTVEIPGAAGQEEKMVLALVDSAGRELIRYQKKPQEELPLPEAEKDFAPPAEIKTVDELWHAGDTIYKFRNPDRGRRYFEEALRRDPGDSRSRMSLAKMELERGNFASALEHLAVAVKRDRDNAEIYYLRGLAKEWSGDYTAAYDDFYRSTHAESHVAKGFEQVARLDLRKQDFEAAVVHAEAAIRERSTDSRLWSLHAAACRLKGDSVQAERSASRAQELDPLNAWAANELALALGAQQKDSSGAAAITRQLLQGDPHIAIETALSYSTAGLYAEAARIIEVTNPEAESCSALAGYYNGYFKQRMGKTAEAGRWFSAASRRPVDGLFPFRIDAIEVFKTALEADPKDGRAEYFLGLVYAGISDVEKATSHWEKATALDSRNARAWRNLGLALLHGGKDTARAEECYKKALELAPTDSRILLELYDVKVSRGETPSQTIAFLRQHLPVVEKRDALLSSYIDLLLQEGSYREALNYLTSHHFHSWEGRYTIHNAYMEANLGLAEAAGSPSEALKYYEKACEYPANLEVAPREPNLRGFLYYPMAKLNKQLGNEQEALRLTEATAREETERPTLATYYQALALRELGKKQEADRLLTQLKSEAEALMSGSGARSRGRGPEFQQALGKYYQSKYLLAAGDEAAARKSLEEARALVPLIERQAVTVAQIAYARAHQ